jgi:RNA polymerase sigma-70 factor (ECF subfamily)
LLQCLQKLKARDRELIQQRYAPGESGKHLAGALGRPANSVYQSLGRIRRTLWECIQRRLSAESAT